MLKRITCEQFKAQPLEFRTGLNVVLGSSGGCNAIGKSTFLLILDFAFGGDDYTKAAKDVFEEVGHHQINIEFAFDGQSFYFFRTTNRPNTINRCDSQYQAVIKEMTLSDYRDFLFHEYKITLVDLKFNEIVARFFRIYGRGNHNEHIPLKAERESMATAVDYLMKLLDMYEDIRNFKTAEDSHRIKPSKQAERSVSDISAEIGDNKAKIDGLERRRENLSKRNEEANLRALGIDPEKSARLISVISELRQLDGRKTMLQSQLDAIRNNMPENNGVLRRDFTALLRFFPDADLDAMTDVENFHAKINGFLRSDIEGEIARLEPLIAETNADIATLQKQLEESGVLHNLSQSILSQYARVTREIDDLQKKIDELEKELKALEKRKEIELMLLSLRRKQTESLTAAAKRVNAEMERINAMVTDGNRPAPELTIEPDKSIEFGTAADKSEGTTFKNLVVYDLSMLAMTPLPAIIHDSSIVKRIEDADFEQILGLYEGCGKDGRQVFIAFDRADTYTEKTHDMLQAATILRLSVGNELFGESWSRRTETPLPEPTVDSAETEPPEDENSEE